MARKTILLVEDDRSLAEVLAYNLGRKGYDVIVARDATEGLQEATRLLPDLAIVEQDLPRGTGLELCRSLRAAKDTFGIPCILLVDREDQIDQRHLASLGLVDCTLKPFSVRSLLQRASDILTLPAPESAIVVRRQVILFLCTGNSARSQMAEAFLRRYAAAYFDVYSAGLSPKGIHPLTTAVMGEIGFDLSQHRSKGVNEFLGKMSVHQAVIVCQPAEPTCPSIWPFALSLARWPFEDPSAHQGARLDQLAKFRTVRDDIDNRIRQWLSDTGIPPPAPIPRPAN